MVTVGGRGTGQEKMFKATKYKGRKMIAPMYLFAKSKKNLEIVI